MSKLLVDEISDADNTGPVTVTDGLNVSSGNVGIGTSSPERLLHVKGSVAYARIESTSVSQNAMLDIKSTVATWSIGQNAVKIDGSLEFYNGSSTPIFFTTSGAVTVGADLTLANGNLVVASGKGIDFSATAGTGTSELLDDYEEGTWTPTIASGTVTYSAQRGRYTKIGRMVYVHCFISIASISGSSDTNIISGLPFVSKNDSNYSDLASKTNGFAWGGAQTMITFQVTPNSINISAVASGNNQTFLDVTTAGLVATDWIACTGHYVTDA